MAEGGRKDQKKREAVNGRREMVDGKTKLVISSVARNLSVRFRRRRSLSSFGMTTSVKLTDY